MAIYWSIRELFVSRHRKCAGKWSLEKRGNPVLSERVWEAQRSLIKGEFIVCLIAPWILRSWSSSISRTRSTSPAVLRELRQNPFRCLQDALLRVTEPLSRTQQAAALVPPLLQSPSYAEVGTGLTCGLFTLTVNLPCHISFVRCYFIIWIPFLIGIVWHFLVL